MKTVKSFLFAVVLAACSVNGVKPMQTYVDLYNAKLFDENQKLNVKVAQDAVEFFKSNRDNLDVRNVFKLVILNPLVQYHGACLEKATAASEKSEIAKELKKVVAAATADGNLLMNGNTFQNVYLKSELPKVLEALNNVILNEEEDSDNNANNGEESEFGLAQKPTLLRRAWNMLPSLRGGNSGDTAQTEASIEDFEFNNDNVEDNVEESSLEDVEETSANLNDNVEESSSERGTLAKIGSGVAMVGGTVAMACVVDAFINGLQTGEWSPTRMLAAYETVKEFIPAAYVRVRKFICRGKITEDLIKENPITKEDPVIEDTWFKQNVAAPVDTAVKYIGSWIPFIG